MPISNMRSGKRILSLRSLWPILFVIFSATRLWAQDDIVTVPGTYTTIQAAVNWYDDTADDAQSNVPPSGGNLIIEVAAGTYTEAVTVSGATWTSITRRMIIRPAGGASVTIDGGINCFNFFSGASYVTVSGFTMIGTTSHVVNIGAGCSNISIQGNEISIDGQFNGINMFGGGTKISFNMITHTLNGTNNVRGINVNSGGNEIYFNSIYMRSADITNDSVSDINHALFFNNNAGGATFIKNNIFYGKVDGLDANDQSSVYLFNVGLGTAGTDFISDSNDFHRDIVDNGTVFTGYYGGTSRLMLADWRGATAQDGTSLQTNPLFVSANDLHLQVDSPVRGMGVPIAGYTIDIDDENLNATAPDMGADEIPPASATPMSGVYDVDDNAGGYDSPPLSGNGVADYTSVIAAIAELKKRGLSGTTTLNVWGGTYLGQINIGGIGTTTVNTLTIVEKSGDNTVLNPAAGDEYTIRFWSGQSNVFLSGFDIGGGGLYAIRVSGSNNQINANRISVPGGAGYGIYLDINGSNTKVTNNMIYDTVTNTTGARGIHVASGGHEIYYNSLYIRCESTGPVGNTVHYGLFFDATGPPTNIKYNIFHGKQVGYSGSDTAFVKLFYVNSGIAGSNFFSDGNDFFRDTTLNGDVLTGYYGATDRQTLADWKLATGEDGSSIQVDPLFVNAPLGDLHISGSSPPSVRMGAQSVFAGAKDYDGEARRPVNLAIGADELVDTTGPAPSGMPSDGSGADIDFQTNNLSVSATWTGVFSDAESGIVGYAWAIGTTSGGTNVMGYTSVGMTTTGTATVSPQSDGVTLYVSVRTTNGAGLQTVVTSDGVMVDSTAPLGGLVNDGTGADIDVQGSTTLVNANWSTFSDPHSGIVGYQWAIGTTSGGTELQGFTPVGLATSGTATVVAQSNGTLLYVSVRAFNGSGLQITAISDSVQVDTTPPDTTITSNPPSVSGSTTAAFSFTSTETGSTFQRNLDGGGWTPVTSPETVTGLGNGPHTYQVRAVDPAVNIDPTPASYSWTVDTVAPDTTITSGPPALSATTTATFSFTATETATFQRSLDGGGWTAVLSPEFLSGLAQGSHTYQVRAIDSAGNTDSTPASYSWTVDSVAPGQPAAPDMDPASDTGSSSTDNLTSNTAPAFIGGVEPNATVQLYANGVLVGTVMAGGGGAYFVASSALTEGGYSFTVVAIDAAGNASSPSPALAGTIDASPPTGGIVNDGSAADIDFQASTTSLSANWSGFADAGSGISLYEWAIGTTTGATDVQAFTGVGLAPSASNTSLSMTAGSTVYVTVRATNGAGLFVPVTSDGVRIAIPAIPMNLSAMPGDGQVSLSWDPSLGAAGYRLYYGAASGSYSGTDALEGASPISVGTNSITLTGLTNGTTYFLVVTAVSAGGLESAASTEIDSTPVSSGLYTHVRNLVGGDTPEFYRMVSFPVLPPDVDPVANLADNLGPYDPAVWRMFAYDASSGTYIEMDAPGGIQMVPGQAFWLISRTSASVDVTGSLADTSQDFAITLQPGWNMIGHPFSFPVNWAEVEVNGVLIGDPGDNGYVLEVLWDWVGSYISVDQLVPGRGYWVRNDSGTTVSLLIPAISAPLGAIDPNAKPAQNLGEVAFNLAPEDMPPPPPGAPKASSGGGGGGGGGGCYVSTASRDANMSGAWMVGCLMIVGLLATGLKRPYRRRAHRFLVR